MPQPNLDSEPIEMTTCRTALGWVGIASSTRGLLMLTPPEPTDAAARQIILACWPRAHAVCEGRETLKTRLIAYFEGQVVDFASEALDTRGMTDFQRRVHEITRAIPRGETRSYGQVARKASSPRAARAVGRVMATNPWPIIVPCHRVIGSDGSLIGFGGGLDMKRRMLELEGALEPQTEGCSECASA